MNEKVVIGIVVKDSNVLIVKRKAGEGDLRWQFPGGTVELNESEQQAIIREIKEETGCNVRITKLIGERVHPYTKKFMSYWVCEYLDGELNIGDDDLEDIQWVDKMNLLNYFTTAVYPPILEYLNIK